MTEWKYTFDIRDIWKKRNGECGPEDWTDKTVHELAKEIARRIERKFPQHMINGHDWDPALTEVYDWFVSIQTQQQYKSLVARMIEDGNVSDDEVSEITINTPMREFNNGMDLFYEWCDDNRVWINK